MNTTTIRTQFVLVVALLVFAMLAATSPVPACVVGAGTIASCTEPALDACLRGGGGVTFNCSGAATITVMSTKTITADTTIDGGSVTTLSGGGTIHVFAVNGGVTLVLNNLTIMGGKSAFSGAILNNGGTVTVTNSTFSRNSASFGGAIFNNGGTVSVTNGTFSGNNASFGGAIQNDGSLTVTDTTFSGNNASFGGAIDNGLGTLTVTNSTFSGNSASSGGAISNGNRTATVTNCTFSGNSAPSGGGAIEAGGGSATITNSILTSSPSGGNCSQDCGTISDGGHNIDDGTTCPFSGANCSATTGTSICNTDPKLAAALANNGGPTQTLALQSASPAINAGDETVCAAAPINNLDQRGFVRPGVGATKCSIGAYEFNGCTSPRCLIEGGLRGPLCARDTLPAGVTKKFDQAAGLIDQAATSPAKQGRKLLKKAKKALKRAGIQASRAAKGKHAKISTTCAMALKGAAEGVIAGLGV